MVDPHAVLGVAPGSSPEAVRRAFKRAVRHSHPDLHAGDPSAAERLRAIVDAYHELERRRRHPHASSTDPTKRTVVTCRIQGADLVGVICARLGVSEWRLVDLRAFDACGICGGLGHERVVSSWWRVARLECEVCRGGGIVRVTRRVRLRVPSVTAFDIPLRLRGIGLARPGGPRGDALLFVVEPRAAA